MARAPIFAMLGMFSAMVAGPALAQSNNDVRCVLASNAATKVSKSVNEQRVAEATMHFYLGRIDGKYDSARLQAAFATQLKTLTGKNIGPTMQACYAYAQQRMQFVRGVGARLSPPKK